MRRGLWDSYLGSRQSGAEVRAACKVRQDCHRAKRKEIIKCREGLHGLEEKVDKKIILVSHGKLAEGMLHSVRMIVGEDISWN